MSPLLACLLLAGAVSAELRFPTAQQKHAEWHARTIVSELSDATPEGLELAHVNAIWRHGDRAPQSAMPGEKATEEYWTFGGGGWGELSPIGMRQHYKLGKKLYNRYAVNSTHLSESYKSKEIYVHCTDRNRTIISATSNLVGMYSQAKAKVNRDYPDVEGWPAFFVPIPVHAEWARSDHIGDPSFKCPRQNDLLYLLHLTNDYKEANGPEAQVVLQYLRDAIGVGPSVINFDNVHKIWDNMNIESVWFPENISTWYPYYTQNVSDAVDELVTLGIIMQNGIVVDNVVHGVDLAHEIPTIRGGPLINDIMAKARGVLQCRLRDDYGQVNGCKDSDTFYRNLKYHAISAHDSTVDAYLTVLGAKLNVWRGNPLYTATVLTEFFIDSRNVSLINEAEPELVFRVLYHDDENSDFRVITPFVDGCNEDFCPLQVLQNIADKYAPPGGIEQLCLQRIPL